MSTDVHEAILSLKKKLYENEKIKVVLYCILLPEASVQLFVLGLFTATQLPGWLQIVVPNTARKLHCNTDRSCLMSLQPYFKSCWLTVLEAVLETSCRMRRKIFCETLLVIWLRMRHRSTHGHPPINSYILFEQYLSVTLEMPANTALSHCMHASNRFSLFFACDLRLTPVTAVLLLFRRK